MKPIKAHQSLLRFAASLMLLALFPAISTYAQSGVNNHKEEPARVQYSSDDLESLRADLIAFVRANQDLAGAVNPKLAEKYNGIEEQLKKLSVTQLNILRNGLPDVSILSNATSKLLHAVEKSNLNRLMSFNQKNGLVLNSASLPDADYPSCGSTRTDDDIIDASDTALFVAEGVRDLASRGCDEVIVILGEGGNASLVCIITDAVYVTAKSVNYGLHYCNDKIDSAEQQAVFTRLEHLHTDLEDSIINDDTNTTTITGAVTTAKNNIVANDNTNTTTITTAISNSQGAIVDNANGNTAALTTAISNTQLAIINNDNTNKNTIVANANANATMLTNLLLRTQIESDLAAGDNATPVGLYQTPGTICSASAPLNQCGLLGLVRLIVVQTISNLAGSSTSQANSFLAKGDKDLAAGNYKSAYQWYRQAYKTAVK